MIALDFATTTGWAKIKGISITSGFVEFKTKSKEPKDLRLIKFREWLNTNCKDVSIIAYEAVRTMKSANAVVCLAEYQSILKVFALENNIQLMPFSAKQIKKHIAGNGNASKQMVMDAVNAKYGLTITNDNQSDAVALLSLALHDIYIKPNQ